MLHYDGFSALLFMFFAVACFNLGAKTIYVLLAISKIGGGGGTRRLLTLLIGKDIDNNQLQRTSANVKINQ